jgi:hypothetical protein
MERSGVAKAGTFCFKEEFGDLDFGDERLNKRFMTVIESINKQPHGVIKRTQKSWTDMVGVYRMLTNERVERDEILRVHREQTIARMICHERVLVLQDTTSLCYSRLEEAKGLGSIAMGAFGSGGKGILAHTTLAVTTTGTPLGILDQDLWSRGIGDPHERYRWIDGIKRSAEGGFTQVINVGDREIDGVDVYATAYREGVDFVTRAKSELRMSDEHADKTIADVVREQSLTGKKTLELYTQKIVKQKNKTRNRFKRKVKLEIRFAEVQLRAGKCLTLETPATTEERRVYAVLVEEINPPKSFEPIRWLLFTSLEVKSLEQAEDIVGIYKVRWEIEVFHKLLKSACSVEKAQLEHADRLKKLITILSIVAWRLHVLTKLQREAPDLPCTEVLTTIEWNALYVAMMRSRAFPQEPPSLRQVTLWIAKLGGFIGRKSDGEPGPIALWQGWIKLIHYTEMYEAMAGL